MAWNFAVLWFQVQVVDETNDANIDLVLLAQASGRPWLANTHNLRKQQFEVLSILNTQTPLVINIASLKIDIFYLIQTLESLHLREVTSSALMPSKSV